MTTGAPRSRPVLVTVAVVLWLALFAFQFVSSLVGLTGRVRADGPLALPASVIGLAVLAWFVFGALRVGRGSGRARFWMAVLGALAVVGAASPPYGAKTVIGVLSGVAAVLPYLPAARAYFPPRPRRVRKPAEARVVGWDPDTGEPIRASE
ncbi:hypothetical protein [Curtobacterium pusillum]|uniref:hypothetical protein n=1 Tax=Curtobacterium pusillum TaxID=69373 RepID=UPI0011A9AEBD|nr:hypothetical protein [Curtobacterium pusillum]